jgi:hypothetical protein
MVRHKNDHGYWENVDRLPIPGCSCDKCGRARRSSGSRGRGGHRGDWSTPVHGWIDGRPVTASFGQGTKEGHTQLVDGHVDIATFWQRSDRNHYGSGNGAGANVKDRFGYTGPGA